VCISPSASVLQNMETLPWSGTVHVTCEDHYKVIFFGLNLFHNVTIHFHDIV
jgi:hypothetical protein